MLVLFISTIFSTNFLNNGLFISLEIEVIAKAKKVWVDAGNKDRKIKDLKTMDLYLKPEENAVYYVFNEEESGSFPLYE